MARKMNQNLYQCIKNKFSVVETEVWDFNNGDMRTVDPTLTQGWPYAAGIAIYLVPNRYCGDNI